VACSLSSSTSFTSVLARGPSANGMLPPIPPPQYRTAMGSNWQPDRPSPSKCSSARARGQCVASEGTRVEEGLTPVAPLFLAQ